MLYIDFDGVILDTWRFFLEQIKKLPNYPKLTQEEIDSCIVTYKWNEVLRNSIIINDSVKYLKELDPNVSFILTKVQTMDESIEKVKWIRQNGIKQDIIIVPYHVKKTDIVNPNGNVLIDDSLRNLIDWVKCGGYPVFFDSNNTDIDCWEDHHTQNFTKTDDLSICKKLLKKD